jgi:hypothetical protein
MIEAGLYHTFGDIEDKLGVLRVEWIKREQKCPVRVIQRPDMSSCSPALRFVPE